tara:strand:+ start:10412 stop:11005 length:594 start_codon:yes stop_codon:yes gene_type:complete
MSQTHVTPVGEAIYPHLQKPDTKFNSNGEYKVTLKVKKSDASEMLEIFKQAEKDSLTKAIFENKGKQLKQAPSPYTEEGDFVMFKFKMTATGVNRKTKENFTQRPAIFDAKKNIIPVTQSIWGGSEMKIAYELIPYYMASRGAGISVRLKQVQIVKLVEGGTAPAFTEEDGFEINLNAEAVGEKNEEQTEVQESTNF